MSDEWFIYLFCLLVGLVVGFAISVMLTSEEDMFPDVKNDYIHGENDKDHE